MTTKPDLLQLSCRVLAEQPFSVLLGAELNAFEPSRAELRLPVRDELKQQHGFVHVGKNQAVCRCDIFAVSGDQEKLCTTAQGTIALTGAQSTIEA